MKNNQLQCGDYFHFISDVRRVSMTKKLIIGGYIKLN